MAGLKGDFLNKAFERARVSGLTRQPTPEDLTRALHRLENMAAEWFGDNIDVGYAFEDTPDTGTPHNVERQFWNAFESCLAVRLLADYNKPTHPELKAEAATAFARLSGRTAQVRRVRPPARYPRGSGNTQRTGNWLRYSETSEQAPIAPTTFAMAVGEIRDFTEHFDNYLLSGETVGSYTLEASSGITVSNDALASPDITYRVEATAETDNASVKITATTSLGRKEIRVINFVISEAV